MTEVEGCMFTIIQLPQHVTYDILYSCNCACALVRIAAVCTIKNSHFEIQLTTYGKVQVRICGEYISA